MNDEWDEEDYIEGWGEDEHDSYTSEEDDWIQCPNCQSEVYHDAQRCPECGEYIIDSASPSKSKPLWVVVIAVILVILFLIQGFSF